MRGRRVAVGVAGERRVGTVTEVQYTVKGGQPVLAVSLDAPLPDGRERVLASPDDVASVDG